LFTEDQHAFAEGQGNFYRPLLSVSFMFDYIVSTLGETRPDPTLTPSDLGTFYFHLSSTLWHIAAALFLLALMIRLGAPRPVQAIVPLLYVVHPLHTEAVAYISGRADSMSAAFIFAGLYFATWHETPRRSHAGLALTLLCFAGGLLSKESTLIFPWLVALVVLATPRTGQHDKAPSLIAPWMPVIGSFVLLAIYSALRLTVLNFGSDSTPPDSTLLQRITEALQAFALYIGLIFAPVRLHMERTLAEVPPYVAAIGLVLLLACLAIIVLALRKGHPRTAFGMAWFLVAWLPISGIYPLNAPMAEHWMYVPLAGFLWAGAEMLQAILRTRDGRPRLPAADYAAATLLVLWLAILLALTAARNRDWHDNESIYTATLHESPGSLRVHFNLAVTYDDLLDNPYAARRHYEAVTQIYRDKKREDPSLQNRFWNEELEAYLSLGDIYVEQRRFAEAFNHYNVVLATEPNESNMALHASASYGVGRCLLAAGEHERALQHFEEALQILPDLRIDVERLLIEDRPLK
ncbi:MAG: tetratricopeptide repeat protein, partial [Candidatus Hydrogenedentes bacterium]|nr:tetratricopeptide repeat protein [Candidatus Hydrogenedentota bacterium]